MTEELERKLQERIKFLESFIRGLHCHGFERLDAPYDGIPKGKYVFNIYLPVELTPAHTIEEMQKFLTELNDGQQLDGQQLDLFLH